MIEAWRKQFSVKQLSLSHDRPLTFVISQWQTMVRPSPIYVVYRWAIALFFLITMTISIIDLKHPDASSSMRAKWLIYLTNWGYTACTFQALLGALILTACIFTTRTDSFPKLQQVAIKFYKIYWLVNTVATVVAFGITTLYWSIIYDEHTMDLDAINIIVHANNSVLMMLDLFVVAHPIRLLHCCYPVIFGMCYTMFSIIFYVAGGISKEGHRYIYTILNWENPTKTTIICIAVTGYIVVVHVFTWGMYKLRMWIHSKIRTGNDNKEYDDVSRRDPIEIISKNCYFNKGLANDAV